MSAARRASSAHRPAARRRGTRAGGPARAAALGLLAALLPGPAGAHGSAGGDPTHGEAAGGPGPAAETAPLFEPPEPGSYELPVIQRVDPHPVLDADGRRTLLPDPASGRIAVVSFVYTACPDARGCPLAFATLDALDEIVAADPELADRVELVSVSFDPERDTPERMRALREALAPRSRWRFLTPAEEGDLGPLLRDFGQDALRLTRETGEVSPVIRHVLKLFLVDPRGRVRNVYSAGLLDLRLLVADLRTLVREEARAPAR